MGNELNVSEDTDVYLNESLVSTSTSSDVVVPVVVAGSKVNHSISNNIFEEIDSQTNIVCVPDILGKKSCGSSSKNLSVQGHRIIDDLTTDIFDFNIFMNMKVLKSILELVGKCLIRNSNIDLNPDVENKNGLSIPLQLNCISCKFNETFHSCESEEKKKVGQAGFDINRRIILSYN